MPTDEPTTKPAGRKFPCPQCGARLDFDPAAGGLKCPYCGFERAVATAADAEVLERDYKEYLAKVRRSGGVQGLAGRSKETKCPGCGAVVLLEDNVVTDKCPFCLTHLDDRPEPVEGLIEPESLLPFAIDLRAARKAFDEWLSGLWFAPTELKQLANLGQLTGVYVPYWTYDTMTHTYYDGERGENYTDYETVTVQNQDGSTRTERRAVTRIRWWPVFGEVQHFFDDVLVCGSRSLPDPLIQGLEPWDLGRLEPFRPDFLSGFRTERYAVGLEDGLEVAKKLIDPEIYQLVCRDIGGDHQRVHSRKTRYSAVTFKHTLLPVWVAAYRYREAVYQILVNGRSAKVVGKRPWSAWKIARLVLLIALAVLLVALVVAGLKR
jgi:DNA-directed RNA polymerase subunit RPC12/RpoP